MANRKNSEGSSSGASTFDRDFGYLAPFMDKVAQAAGTLTDPSARAELTRLMTEEKARWARIRQLLAGSAGRATAPAPATVDISPRPAARPAASGHSLTVGNLRRGT